MNERRETEVPQFVLRKACNLNRKVLKQASKVDSLDRESYFIYYELTTLSRFFIMDVSISLDFSALFLVLSSIMIVSVNFLSMMSDMLFSNFTLPLPNVL